MAVDPTQHVSHSSLTLHRKCPQAWHYKHVRGLREVITAPQVDRELGTWWHTLRAADAIARGVAGGSLLHAPKKLRVSDGLTLMRVAPFEPGTAPLYQIEDTGNPATALSVAYVFALARAYWATLDTDTKEAWTDRIGVPLDQHLQWLDTRWRNRWADSLAYEEPLGVEVKWVLPLPGTEAQMVGYIDEVYRDTRRGLVVVRDAKTKRSLDSQTAADDLSDSQLHVYTWGLREWANRHALTINAVQFDRVRSAPAKQPQVTQSGSLSKSVTDYDLDTYLTFCRGEDGHGVLWGTEGERYKTGKKAGEAKWGRYVAEETVIERLSSPVALSIWHQRTLVPLNRNIVTAHVQAAIDTQRDTERTLERIGRIGAAPRNFTKEACRFCEFSGLCRAEMIGGPEGTYDLAAYGLVEDAERKAAVPV